MIGCEGCLSTDFPDDDGHTHLEVSALGLQPVVDKALRISSKTQHELSLGFQLVNGLNGFMDLIKQTKERPSILIN